MFEWLNAFSNPAVASFWNLSGIPVLQLHILHREEHLGLLLYKTQLNPSSE